ncbi:MAG: metallophosphoesterase [Chlamydiales bacterium]|nr:metallophosphoesterase [Chlamydiales bacterium]
MQQESDTQYYRNLNHRHGPFDIIGDVHGCFEELCELLVKLGYEVHVHTTKTYIVPPDGRTLVFVGDLVDRGPMTQKVLRLVMDAVDDGIALCVIGNHDLKLNKKLHGRNVIVANGMQESLDALKSEESSFIDRIITFIDSLPYHYSFDDGKLIVAHAGLSEELHGKSSGEARAFATFGAVSHELDEDGFPIRLPWYNDYNGIAMVVYGHTIVDEPLWINNTVDIDTGCVFGGKLTALRYPEQELVAVQAKAIYWPHK